MFNTYFLKMLCSCYIYARFSFVKAHVCFLHSQYKFPLFRSVHQCSFLRLNDVIYIPEDNCYSFNCDQNITAFWFPRVKASVTNGSTCLAIVHVLRVLSIVAPVADCSGKNRVEENVSATLDKRTLMCHY